MNEICHSCQKRTIVCDAHQLCEICEDARDVVTARCFAKVTIAQWKKARKLTVQEEMDGFAKIASSLSFDGLMPTSYAENLYLGLPRWKNDNSR